jgi:hypothetical protein
MPTPQWHPYAPDQAFGSQAARDEELLDAVVADLQLRHARPPRAANRAGSVPSDATPMSWPPRADRTSWLAGDGSGLPVTTASALDAAARLREHPDG